MSTRPPLPDPDDEPDIAPVSRLGKRRDRIAAEIERNRRGEYTVPTWVLAAILVAMLAGWAALIFLT